MRVGRRGILPGIDSSNARPTRSAAGVLLAAALGLSLVVAACGATAGSGRAASTQPASATTQVPAVARPAFTQPSQPISVALGSSFELVLPADPRGGISWQAVAPPNPGVLLSIGSTFRPLPPTTTTSSTTTVPPPPTTAAPTTTTTISRLATTTTLAPPTTPAPTTTTTFPPGATANQVLIYGARGPGTCTITLRYASPKPGAPVLDTVVFTVTVFDPATTTAPPPSTTTTG